ncbi:DUF2884 family protein [Ferrimonas sediminicola]|uniref:DUF2884 family protein n=1 Tax=Ferrimonas sediminicola TaxID=2569538 RepID=A0A4U1BCV1_9GAMM|nr:DUF2884 family protein [Ferrimonas sediminicola]TKB48750.1 DUF2884 family protein [Ferrimonas sediminicola]
MSLSKVATVVVLSSTLASAAALAQDQQCDFSFNHDLVISDTRLEVMEEGRTLYRFEEGRLWVEGERIPLDGSQQQAMSDFQLAIYNQMPATIELVEQALEMASVALDAVATEFAELGVDMDNLRDVADTLAQSVREKIALEDGSYRLVGGDFDQFGDQFDQEFERQLEAAVTQSIGAIMMQMGSAMVNGEGEGFEAKMEAFGERMERMGEQLEQRFEGQEQSLEIQAEALCRQWQQLDEMETQLQQQIPQLQPFDQLEVKADKLAYRWY